MFPVTPNVEPSKVKFASPCTVDESTEVKILLSAALLYVAIARSFVIDLHYLTLSQ